MDLDGLKKINDTFGHPEGDLALVEAAAASRKFSASRTSSAVSAGTNSRSSVENGEVSEEQAILTRFSETLKERKAGQAAGIPFRSAQG